ncbi:MAG: bifunctional riboflavin kinase/FAD synthetase [Pseudomonadota bacterium]
MQLWRGVPPYDAPPPPTAVALGNFDGVHRGHRAVIEQARTAAVERGIALGVVTFEPHPRSVFRPDDPPFRLTLEPLKVRRLEALGVEHCFVLPFNASLARLSPAEFSAQILGAGIGVRHVVTGADFRYGKGRVGDVASLTQDGAKAGFSVETAALAGVGEARFSSSAARQALRDGKPEAAAAILGDWHRIEGIVEKGDQRGRELNYPTANLALDGVLHPAFGIYAVRAEILTGPNKGSYDGVASLGMRPTFDKTVPNFETHIFDFDADIYGETLSVSLIAYQRPEVKFESLDALIAQMDADSREARRHLGLQSAPPLPV